MRVCFTSIYYCYTFDLVTYRFKTTQRALLACLLALNFWSIQRVRENTHDLNWIFILLCEGRIILGFLKLYKHIDHRTSHMHGRGGCNFPNNDDQSTISCMVAWLMVRKREMMSSAVWWYKRCFAIEYSVCVDVIKKKIFFFTLHTMPKPIFDVFEKVKSNYTLGAVNSS